MTKAHRKTRKEDADTRGQGEFVKAAWKAHPGARAIVVVAIDDEGETINVFRHETVPVAAAVALAAVRLHQSATLDREGTPWKRLKGGS